MQLCVLILERINIHGSQEVDPRNTPEKPENNTLTPGMNMIHFPCYDSSKFYKDKIDTLRLDVAF